MLSKLKAFIMQSMFRTMVCTVAVAVAPVFAVTVVTGMEKHAEDLRLISQRLEATVSAISRQESMLAANSRVLLSTLAALEPVKNGNPAECSALFRSLRSTFTAYDNIVLINAQGSIVASAAPVPEAHSLIRRAVSGPGRNVPPMEIEDGKLFFFAQLKDAGGQPDGLLALVTGLEYFSVRLDEMHLAATDGKEDEFPHLRESYRRESITPGRILDGMKLYLADHTMRAVYAQAENGEWEAVHLHAELLLALTGGNGAPREVTMNDGTALVAAAAGIAATDRNEDSLVALLTAPRDIVYAGTDKKFKNYSSVLVSGAALAVVLTVSLCFYFFRAPVRRLLDYASLLRQGNTEIRINERSMPGMFRLCAEKLNSMADKLREREQSLKKASADAEKALFVKNEFLANISHEIRTPMNAILGMTYLALKTPLEPAQKNYINKIHLSGKTLLRIVNDVLDFSRMEMGKLSMEKTRFAPRDLFSGLAAHFQEFLEDKGIQLVIAVDPNVPMYLVGDPLRLEQAIGYLLDNAIQHTSRGIVRLACSLISIVQNECSLRIMVADTGQGMHPGQLHALVSTLDQSSHPGFRGGAENSTTLGLIMSSQLFMMMNGGVHVSSEQGRGTVFTCTARFTYYATEQNQQFGVLRKRRAIIVDDDEVLLPLLANLLASFSMETAAVSTPREAVEILAQAERDGIYYDFCLIDWRSMEQDGGDVFRQLRQAAPGHSPHIIAMSSYGREELRAMSEGAGADAFLHKPINGSILLDTLMGIIEQAENLTKETALPEEREHDPHQRNLSGMRVLLVEDNPISQQLSKEIMEQTGISVTVAANGSEALRALSLVTARPPFDVILMDLQMPLMDGYETTWRIRKDTHLGAEHVPIIAMTAHSQSDEMAACRNADMDDHVAKPIEISLLFAALQRWAPLVLSEKDECLPALEKIAALLPENNAQAIMAFTQQKTVLTRYIGKGRTQKLQRLMHQEPAKAENFLRYLVEFLRMS